MDIDKESLSECVKEIIMTIGALTFEVGFSPVQIDLPNIETYVGTVHILGDWNGCVKVTMSKELARGTAMRVLELGSSGEITLFHVQQFMQEFTNMTGGNLKPMLGERCALSVPKCFETHGFHQSETESTRILEVDFVCEDGGFLSVQLFQATPNLLEEVRAASVVTADGAVNL